MLTSFYSLHKKISIYHKLGKMKKLFGLIILFLFVLSACSRHSSEVSTIKKAPTRSIKKVSKPSHNVDDLYLVTESALEAVSRPLGSEKKKGSPSYKNLPFSKNGGYDTWLRVHQVIFNQVVKVKKKQGNEALIEIPNMVVRMEKSGPPQFLNTWVQTSGLVSLKSFKKEKLLLEKLPYDFLNHGKYPVVTLVKPFYSKKMNHNFSAVTKFTYNKVLKDHVEVNILNRKKMEFEKILIPKNLCYFNSKKTQQQKLSDYITLLQSWAKNKDGFIPYVFGGASWLESYRKDEVYKVKNGHSRRGQTAAIPSGMDCSTMLYLAALVVDIPYYAKNTTTLSHQLDSFKKGDHLEVGDLIWVPGHVQLVSGIGKNPKILEARGYSPGFGKVHEVSMGKLLKGHTTVQSLEEAYLKKKDLVYLNKAGGVHGVYKDWKILKFKSIFKRDPPLPFR
jgi:hypothetical protein